MDYRAQITRQLYQKVNGIRKGYKEHDSFFRNKDELDHKKGNSGMMGRIF